MSNSPVPPRQLSFSIVDVFAERPLEGNALAIFHDARDLSTEQMQSIARETNLSETTFIFPRDTATEQARGVQARIFTTTEELPFAGHPTLGTATWIFNHHPNFRGQQIITLDLPVGPVPVRFDPAEITTQHTEPSTLPGTFATMRQNDPTFGATHSPEPLARALGLTPGDLDPDYPAQTVSTGLPFCIVPLRSLDVARRLDISQTLARPYLEATGARFFFCITRAASGSGADWHARMQWPGGEDPATGSASGCAISWLVRHGIVPSEHPTILEQGIEIHRPSRLHLQARLHNRGVSDVFVGGRTISVATGHLFLP